jgi:hypothetical protein
MYPFERFTDPAKAVLSGAQKEAELAGHSYIGTEHLLLGMMGVAGSVGARALASLGIEVAEVRRVIVAVLGSQEREVFKQIIPTARVKKVIELAFGEAQRLGRSHVGTGELLVALAMEGEGIAAHVLKDMHAGPKQLASAVAATEASGWTETAPAPTVPHTPATVSVGAGARVLVHDPDPPHRLWEGRIVAAGPQGLEIEVADRPAGGKMIVDAMLVHPIPTGHTLYCRYCSEPSVP